ncbi:hypothetical protein CY34DRAFT_678247 [Suillus luteus UH-Slu-Lm8-n1]|uniref:Uncharacterized protein n=1 Tax=Suillus luteus UH-Slu-Lm8-n1 TaxID=930992 RepID=A0A0D0AI54_9AGAM|nr:hypothetical protein CY34DRAFT_678247 [Suillus luteus UH-Slu-Lm8-n1]
MTEWTLVRTSSESSLPCRTLAMASARGLSWTSCRSAGFSAAGKACNRALIAHDSNDVSLAYLCFDERTPTQSLTKCPQGLMSYFLTQSVGHSNLISTMRMMFHSLTTSIPIVPPVAMSQNTPYFIWIGSARTALVARNAQLPDLRAFYEQYLEADLYRGERHIKAV